ncbi:MAG TPA: pentapeptide repeat-containing protein [Streptosporangiaceae bacterium]|nr:pentapeptide repeat-containing protein [Streptosporangiaceae bacterium]
MRPSPGKRNLAFQGKVVAVLMAVVLPALAAAFANAAVTGGCKPGSGPQLASQRITAAVIARYPDGLRCANLAKANLSGLGVSQMDLTKPNFRHANLHHADLGQATLSGAILIGANLSSADLIQAALTGADLTRADLRGAKPGQATMTRANLSRADLWSADLDQATMTKANLTRANLTRANLSRASLDEVTANGTIFRSATPTDASFTGTTLTGAQFKGAKLQRAEFESATNPPATPSGGGIVSSGGDEGEGAGPLPDNLAPLSAVTQSQLKTYLLIFVVLIFVTQGWASIRRHMLARAGWYSGGRYGAGVRYRGYGGPGGFAGPGGFGGPGFASGPGFGGPGGINQTTPMTPAGPFDARPGAMPGAMPGGLTGAGPQQNTGWQPVRLVLALIGTAAVSVGLYLFGSAMIDALLIPAGDAIQLCAATCGDRIGAMSTGLTAGVVMIVVGGILKRIGWPRFRY